MPSSSFSSRRFLQTRRRKKQRKQYDEMKKCLIFFAIAVCALSVRADEFAYPYLVLEASDGTLTSVSVASLTLKFEESSLVLTNDAGSRNFALSGLKKMYFATKPTAISTSKNNVNENVEVWTMTGLSLGVFDSISEAQQTLSRGVYVVKSERGTFKIAVK